MMDEDLPAVAAADVQELLSLPGTPTIDALAMLGVPGESSEVASMMDLIGQLHIPDSAAIAITGGRSVNQ